MASESNKDYQIYNVCGITKIIINASNVAWQQIDSEEMRTIADQAKESE